MSIELSDFIRGVQWMGTSTFNMVTGRGGRILKERRETEGINTFLGPA